MSLKSLVFRTMIGALVAACACAILFVILPVATSFGEQLIGTSTLLAVAGGLSPESSLRQPLSPERSVRGS
ncbi:MAG: hypothetical protein EXS03_04145 [Phycisphaerales bacterium]|nr:hypothetical protein [Phycisphaerales bacterium]